ncbi:hypothetical protein [Vibrio palustris]|uniref:Uncharacterized protein n=1 Tax=Vibrio palustris TaxID=1918946 RepID=A0A1R4B4S7_9VIBR|nr:hypothetical protein [Vibrio palustris]SJL83915.1 hypothetical protein VPAL9027_01894 [Vibrio palustris]
MSQIRKPLHVTIDPVVRSLTVGEITVPLSAKLLALYAFIVFTQNRSITVNQAFMADTRHSRRYLNYVWFLRGDVRIYQTFGLEDEGDVKYQRYETLLPITAKFIQEVRAQIHAILRRTLPADMVDIIKIHSDGIKGSCTYHIDTALEIGIVDARYWPHSQDEEMNQKCELYETQV